MLGVEDRVRILLLLLPMTLLLGAVAIGAVDTAVELILIRVRHTGALAVGADR